MTNLTERLENATEGSRKLSDKILLAAGWEVDNMQRGKDIWYSPDGKEFKDNRPDPSRSLDAALTLVPEGDNICWSVAWPVTPRYWARLWTRDYGKTISESFAVTPALALCAAALKAMEKQDEK